MIRRALLVPVLFFCLAAPALAAEPPPEVKALLDRAAQALQKKDEAALQAVSTKEPKALYPWLFRPGAPAGTPGVLQGSREWKAGALHPPGAPEDEWLIVFWALHPCESTADHVHRLVADGSARKVGDEIFETDTLGYRIRSHDVAVTFDLPHHGARFTNTVTIDRVRPRARQLQLRLSADFTVDSIKEHDRAVPFSQVGGVIYADPPAEKVLTLRMEYHGEPNHPQMFVGNFVDPSEVVLSAYWYPTIARLPSTHTVTADVPKGWTAIGQGNLVARSDGPDSQRFTFRMDVPTCYFTFDAGPYYVYQKRVNGRTYGVYMLKPDRDRAERQLDMVDGSFRLFERLWGPYPYDHYTIVETAQPGWMGALEAYTFTTYGQGLMPSSDPHEWGHTWWGGFVPCTYLQDIWNESFAVYSSSVYNRHGEAGDPALMERVYWDRPSPGMEKQVMAMPLSETADSLYGPSAMVGYGKGGLVMQNLEETLGFDTLARCMRTFREQLPFGAAPTWADFERVVDRVTGQDYTWWFDQWVRRKGLPSLKWENVKMAKAGDGFEVTADLVQEGEPYRLRVPIWLDLASGATLRTDQEISQARTPVKLHAAAAPHRLLLDPDRHLPRAVAPEEAAGGFLDDTGGHGKVLVVTDAANRPQAERMARFMPGATLKPDGEVKDEDLKGTDVVLLGTPATNQVWARLAAHCPFQVADGTVTYHGKTYPLAQAYAVTPNPQDAARMQLWLTGGSLFGLPLDRARSAVLNAHGHVLDAEVSTSAGGPGVWEFTGPTPGTAP